MVVEGRDGTRLGTVERLEIDASGRLTDVVVRVGSARGACKRVAANYIQSVRQGILTLALPASDVLRLSDDQASSAEDKLFETLLYFPELR
jgi:hypothetical protein